MTTNEEVEGVFREVMDKIAVKNNEYSDAWRRQGWMGNLARILSKTSRLKALCWKDSANENRSLAESVEDTALDLIAITAFFLINRRNGNRWG